MKACGIVVEYNPFHNGHIHHIQKAKEVSGCDVLVAVMSGNFVQRGQRAIIDKWARAQAAVENGVDLVLELPFLYACQAASQFANGAVHILNLAQVESLVFGSETNNLEELKMIASIEIEPNHLKECMRTGISYPKAYGLFANEFGPNDILGIAYCKAIRNTDITPYSILRTTEYHDDQINGNIASATAIRKAAINNEDVSNSTVMDLTHIDKITLKDYWPVIRLLLLNSSSEDLSEIFLFSEGIENNFKRQAELHPDYDEFLKACTSKRYTTSRIQRTLLHLLLQNKKEDIRNLPVLDTIRPLAFNEKGREYLKELKKKEVKVASKFNQIPNEYRQIEYKAAVLYSTFSDNYEEEIKKELQSPIYIKK